MPELTTGQIRALAALLDGEPHRTHQRTAGGKVSGVSARELCRRRLVTIAGYPTLVTITDLGRAAYADVIADLVPCQVSRAGLGVAAGFVAWPKDQPPRYNACTEPCDMWTGPCACGAWHTEGK